ncbi:MAG: tetratricopeptide repeat protein [Alphaproteobacteria bacterium]|nr:tetratricopeptide repeat protein [Alphaproteobacteria bacterium]
MTSIADTFQRALQSHQASRLAEAEHLYGEVLAVEPDHIDAQHLLGVLALQTGRAAAGAQRIAAAIAALAASGAPASPVHAAFHVNLGNALHAVGRTDDAVAAYRQALVLDPASAHAHSNLGNVLQARGELEAAVESYGAALRLEPGHAQAHYNLGNAYAALGRADAALASYRAALTLRPDYAEALNNLANLLQTVGRIDEAIEAYRRALALTPDAPRVLVNLGTALRAAGQIDEAIAQYERALARDPDDAEAHFNLANARLASGLAARAEAGYARAIALRPDYAEAHYNLASLLKARGEIAPAITHLARALTIQPDMLDALFNLANLLQDEERFDEAITLWRRLLVLEPDHPQALVSLGNGLQQQGKLAEALASYRQALAVAPDLPEAHYNFANTLQDDGQIHVALAHYGRAVALRPDYVEAHWNRSLALLATGDLTAGWPEYEWRWRRRYSEKLVRRFDQPLWRGQDLTGKRILLHAEQGLGDTLQFCRYLPLVAARAPAEIVLEVPKPLLAVMTDSWAGPGVRIVPMDPDFPGGDGLPPFDYHCPLMSLPLAFETTLDSIPAAMPYLRADPARADTWRRRLAGDRGYRIGLVWAGGIRPNDPQAVATDRKRSITLAQLAPLAGLPGVSWYSLQKGAPAEQARRPPDGMALVDLMGEVQDFADTAALAAQLDLVISVDTAVAHLAGGLARPVWLLSRFDGCWRWLLERDDSPWYPTMRLYRQAAPGAWAPVIERLAGDLDARLRNRGA